MNPATPLKDTIWDGLEGSLPHSLLSTSNTCVSAFKLALPRATSDPSNRGGTAHSCDGVTYAADAHPATPQEDEAALSFGHRPLCWACRVLECTHFKVERISRRPKVLNMIDLYSLNNNAAALFLLPQLGLPRECSFGGACSNVMFTPGDPLSWACLSLLLCQIYGFLFVNFPARKSEWDAFLFCVSRKPTCSRVHLQWTNQQEGQSTGQNHQITLSVVLFDLLRVQSSLISSCASIRDGLFWVTLWTDLCF